MITRERIQVLFDKYLELVKLEIDEFEVKPTEVRHLIGRIGEFYCALQIDGELAKTVNQHGFDVANKDGRRVSVKTTAQKTGFVSISASTLDKADDLMVVQYDSGKLTTLYYGPISILKDKEIRFYKPSGKYELDISLAKKLPRQINENIQPIAKNN